MSTYLYILTEPQDNSAFVGELLSGDKVYLLPHTTNETLVGEWDNDGELVSMDTAVYNELRPFGNLEGDATNVLDMIHYQGHSQRHMQSTPLADTLPEYYSDNQPIKLLMERWWDDTPGWEGWGWKATITFADPNRAPNARAIGIYDASWGYLYTTGAFILVETGTDELGDPIMQWQTNNPPGQATTDKEPVYYAILFGADQEGRYILNSESVEALFWENDQ